MYMLYYNIHIRINFKTFPEFAGTFYRNSQAKFTGIATVRKEMGIDVLHRFRCAGRRKRPAKRGTNSWFLLHDNAPAHRSVLVKDFLLKNNVTTLEHPLTCLQLIFARSLHLD
jgi:hypothetical protein